MYVSTFYSFKGGVGRSLALANVACELARRGRRVLLVDLDLEAPGLETFPTLQCTGVRPGLVDYINEYTETGNAPRATNFIGECTADSEQTGKLWLMSAGQVAERYGDLFTRIDWQRLYEEHEGYLMFEDLKLQWERDLSPDYVLIDSRTGHTDVGGICTRQLPDSVFLFFFPNEQNLQGLSKVASDIRDEEKARNRSIALNFVLANVPDLDDEHDILKSQLERAEELLGYQQLAATIHHYDSMLLLRQEAFVLSRPKTKLAAEYRQLADAVVRDNIDDKEGVLDYLAKLQEDTITQLVENDDSVHEFPRQRLEQIADKYDTDPSVLNTVAMIYDFQHEYGNCLAVLHRIISLGDPLPTHLLQTARMLRLTEGASASTPLIEKVFSHPDSSLTQLKRGLGWVRDITPSSIEFLLAGRAIERLTLEEQCELLEQMLWQGCEPWAERLYLSLRKTAKPEDLVYRTRHALVLCAIALKRFEEALDLVRPQDRDDIPGLFNRAMADWGHQRRPADALFAQVLECHERIQDRHDSNYWLCIAIAFLAARDRTGCKMALTAARERMLVRQKPEFSPWRYREVSPTEFLRDLEELGRAMEEEVAPPSVRDSRRRD